MLLTISVKWRRKGRGKEGRKEGKRMEGEEEKGTERQIKAHSWSMKTSKEAGPNWCREGGTP